MRQTTMQPSRLLAVLALAAALSPGGTARAGAPQPEQREQDFAHVCDRGANRGLACEVATEDVDCPRGSCEVQPIGPPARGVLTLIAHDTVTDWANGGAPNRALTVLLEVRAPGGTHLLSATYQNLADPTLPPTAPGNIVAIDMDEAALANLAAAVNGLAFAQPDSTLAQALQEIFDSTGVPVITEANERQVQLADHENDDLATVVRFKVKIRFLAPG